MNEILNWTEISRRLANGPGNIRKTYDGPKYKAVIDDIKAIAELIEMRLDNFNEPKGLDNAIKEIEEIDNLKEGLGVNE